MAGLIFDLARLSFQVAGYGAPRLALRYLHLTALNRTARRRVIRHLPVPGEKPEAGPGAAGLPHGDVIVPIYDNFEDTSNLLTALQSADDFDGRIVLVDDASPDERIAPLLEAFASKRRDVTVLRNDNNLGFVGACNRGFAETTRDVVILNTDIILPRGAVGGLLVALQSARDIATVTPFSSNAYGFGFPYPIHQNDRPFGASVEQINTAFSLFAGQAPFESPVGIGFCMAMKREVMDKIGPFDAIFGAGYGEETDFCLRAVAAGYRNMGVPHIYVFHKGGQSFGNWQNKARLGTLRVLHRHPSYPYRVAAYFKRGEMAALGFGALCRLATQMAGSDIELVSGDLPTAVRLASQRSQRPLLHQVEKSGYRETRLFYAEEHYLFNLAPDLDLELELSGPGVVAG